MGSGVHSPKIAKRPMKRSCFWLPRLVAVFQAAAAFLLTGISALAQAHIELDNFNDNAKSGWTDFTFIPGVGLPTETDGQFRFELPKAVLDQVKSGLFSAATKSSQDFELKEGRTVEFRVDLVRGGLKDSFAVLSFIPKSSGDPSKLEGYSLAKSTTDTLLVKGIEKYPIAAGGVKNENVTLVLSLTVKNGAVIMAGKVLDKDSSNRVLWESTFTDTPAEDAYMAGKDLPNPKPFIGPGNFVLYLFADYDRNAVEDPYQVVYDNAQVTIFDTINLDDFDDNSKSEWTDFTFVPGFGLPVESGGQFRFELPKAVLDQVKGGLFSASTKSSREFELKEGTRTEFRVNLVQGGLKDSFAVLSFIPKTSGDPSKLEGYSLAKSTTDTLLVKGIEKYPVAAGGVKNENVTLSLAMEVKNGSVHLEGKVFDRDENNKVLWSAKFSDTPAEDVFVAGKDLPNTAPFLGAGNFVLYLFADYDRNAVEDPYQVTYDNAVVIAPPPPANAPPIITEIQPAEFGNFLPSSSSVAFKVSDDQVIDEAKVSITLNGTVFNKANGLTLTGSGNTRSVSLATLEANKNYVATLSAEDTAGARTSRTIYFDTFTSQSPTIELEDYNFSGGQFINSPLPTPEGGGSTDTSYNDRSGLVGIDFVDNQTLPRAQDAPWRTQDPIRMQRTRDNQRSRFLDAGGPEFEVFDYDVGDIAAGDWMNYTRNFPAGSYEVYLRQAVVNMASGESVLEMVTGDHTQTQQTVKPLGSFLGALTGFKYRNFPLTDAAGNTVVVRLSGETTLRLRQVTTDIEDGGRLQTYLIFVPVADSGLQRAIVSSTIPRDGEVVESISPVIEATLQNRDTSVKLDSIKLILNGTPMTPVVSATLDGATVKLSLPSLPPAGVPQQVQLSFQDNLGVEIASKWSFSLRYLTLEPSWRVAAGPARGMTVRMVQAPMGSNLENSLQRAESQLAPDSPLEKAADVTATFQVINFNKRSPSDEGIFPGDVLPPGLDAETNGDADYALEVMTFLELKKGPVRFGIRSDDGYKIAAGKHPVVATTPALSFEASGTADRTFDLIVPADGVYPFRNAFFERAGASYFEWYVVDLTSGERVLVNDPDRTESIKAFTTGTLLISNRLLESTSLVGAYSPMNSAVFEQVATVSSPGKISIPKPEGIRFYRLDLSATSRINTAKMEGDRLVLTYSLVP